MLVFDIETDGLLDTLTKVHCINLIDRSTGKSYAFNGGVYKDGSSAPRDGTIEDGLAMLEKTDCIAGQNIIAYDVPALKKVYPTFNPPTRVFDTKVASAVIFTNLIDLDVRAVARGRFPDEFREKGLIGRHTLEAWGYRLGEYKGDFKPANYTQDSGEPHTWATIGFTKDMDIYGRQDPVVTLKLVEFLEKKAYSQECLDLEHRVAQVIFRQHERGFAFDVKAAGELTRTLQCRHAELSASLTTTFAPWYAPSISKGTALFTPKSDNKKMGYTKGAELSKVKHVVFNPASRDHIADRLTALHGWRPSAFTEGGKPQIDETVLGALPYPEAKLLAEYLMVEKRLGQVANGDKAWLKFATPLGIYGACGPQGSAVMRIHGTVQTNGAVTGRMTHGNPNVAQTPAVGSPYGVESRACWIASPGLILVGCDAEGIELRALAHYMAKWDDGEYAHAVANGKKEDKSDVHSVNQKAIGLNKRDAAKTFIYALIYGAGDFKLGTIVFDDYTDAQRAAFLKEFPKTKQRMGALKDLGTGRRNRLMKRLPALGKLTEAVKTAAKTKGHLRGLDGRLLHVRAEHAALNTLLQSAGAVIMKKALVLFDDSVAFYRSSDAVVEPVANIHDEFQIETNKEIANEIGELAADCIVRAGASFRLRCPLAGSFSVGKNWAETH